MEAATARKYVSSRIRNLEEENILFHLRFKYVLINQTFNDIANFTYHEKNIYCE